MPLTAAAPAGVTLIATATLAGAWLGRRSHRLPRLSLASAAIVLLVVILADLLPDVWKDLRDTGLPWWAASGTLGAGFWVTDLLIRRGCACGTGPAGGRATAAALGMHRAVEGAALAIAGSAAVIAALVLHAASEGFALAALLKGERRRRAVALLVITCLSPAAGAAVLSQVPLPAAAAPVLTSLVAGVLLRIALAAWQLRPMAQLMDQHRVDDDVRQVRARRVVELAAAGNQAQLGIWHRPVHLGCGKPILGVSACRDDYEPGHRPVRTGHVDELAAMQFPQPEKYAGTRVGVDVADDDRRSDRARTRAAGEPSGDCRAGRHLQRAVAGDPQPDQPRVDADGRDDQPDRCREGLLARSARRPPGEPTRDRYQARAAR